MKTATRFGTDKFLGTAFLFPTHPRHLPREACDVDEGFIFRLTSA